MHELPARPTARVAALAVLVLVLPACSESSPAAPALEPEDAPPAALVTDAQLSAQKAVVW